jgi:hypothetical protein
VLPLHAAGYYNDNINATKRWYLPKIELKTPAEGGFKFKCFKDGIDGEGRDVYKGELTLGFRKSEPDNIRQLREKDGKTITYTPIPISYINGTITLKIEGKDTPVSVNAKIDPNKPDFEIAIPIGKNSLGLWYRTLKDPSLGAPLDAEVQFYGLERPVTPYKINLSDLANKARWISGELIDADNAQKAEALPWQGSAGSPSGFARIDTVYMEDDLAYKALRTHPKWVNRGTIKGFFPKTILPKNARFEAKVGFVKGAKHTDGVVFQVWEHHYDAKLKKEVWNKIIARTKTYDGKLVSISANLAHLEGQEVAIELRVDAGASSGQDWAAWIEPQIKGDEYIKKTVNQKFNFRLSYNCSTYPEFYQFQNAANSSVSFGCTSPWDVNYLPEAPYIAYNKIDLNAFGISAIYKSMLRDDQFLLIPTRYVVAMDADILPEIFVSVKADLENDENSKAILDIKLAPDISDSQFLEIRKKIVQSWLAADISDTIDLIFPNQIDSVANENPTITPIITLNGDENFSQGCGTTLKLSLENLSLDNASLLMLNITEALGRNFPFKFKLGGTMTPAPSVAALTFKDLAGSFVFAARNANTLKVMNLYDREVTISEIVVEMPGKIENAVIPVNKTLNTDEELQIELPTSLQSGIDFAAAYTTGPKEDPYEIREVNITTNNIRQDFTVDMAAHFKDADVKTVEITVQMKNSSNNILEVFSPTKPEGIITLMLPLGFYLSSRIVEYALRITHNTPSKPDKARTGTLDLRKTSLLISTPTLADGEKDVPQGS